MAENRPMKSPDGRLWMVLESHPLTDEKAAICRLMHTSNGRSWLGHTCVWSRDQLAEVEEKDNA